MRLPLKTAVAPANWAGTLGSMAVVGVWTLGAGWVGARLGLDWPAGVLGLVSLAAALAVGVVPARWVAAGAEAWISLLPLFFVPSAAEAVGTFGRLGQRGIVLAGIAVLTVTTVMTLSGLLLRRGPGANGDDAGEGGSVG